MSNGLDMPVVDTVDERLAIRILRHVTVPAHPGECWLWTAYIDGDGYGRSGDSAAIVALAHRLAYEAFVGSIPIGHHVDHTCHNVDLTCPGGRRCIHRHCVNPD